MTLVWMPDLMDRSRLDGRDVVIVRAVADALEHDPVPDLVVVDLSRRAEDTLAVAGRLLENGVRVLGVLPHVDTDLRERASALGVEVVARSYFFTHLDELLA